MSEHEEVLEIYLKEQQTKINELSQQIMVLSTRNSYLEKKLEETQKKLNEYEIINRKKLNTVQGFKHSPSTNR